MCAYVGICKPEFETKEELTLLYGIDSRSAQHLEAQGIKTITQLANTLPENIEDVPYLKGVHKKYKAVLQAKAYLTGEVFHIKKAVVPEGTWVHFDIETNPLNDSGEDHVYLWGFLKPPYNHRGFEYVWTEHENQDREGWLGFLDAVARLKAEYPDLILAHFSNYEESNIKRYAKRYEMEDHSVVQFLKFQAELIKDRREQIKKDILAYNFDDVVATRKLEEWLRRV